MDAELRQHLEAMEGRISDRFTSELTDKINSLEERLNKRTDERIDSLETVVNERIDSLETRVNERIEAVETKLLTAFYEWARPMEMRIRVLPSIDDRVGMLEERVSRIERGDKPPFTRKN